MNLDEGDLIPVKKLNIPKMMKEEIKISVIVPVYNTAKYLPKMFESLEKQTYPYYELILINDGSTDESGEVIKKYIKNKKNVTYIEQENKKQGYTRNQGIKKATGNYILFLDSDDFLETRTLELCVQKVREQDPDFVYFEWKEYHDGKKKFEYKRFDKNLDNKEILENEECSLLLSEKFYYTVTRLYKRDFLIKNNIFYGEGYFYEDHIFFIKTALCAKKVALIHAPLYCYRIHNQATTKNHLDTNVHAISFMKALEDTFKIENLEGEHLVPVLNHIILRFKTIYNKKTPESYQKQFATDFIDFMSKKNIQFNDLLNPYWIQILNENILLNKDVDRLQQIIADKKISILTKIKKPIKKLIKRIIHYKKTYYGLEKKLPIYENTLLFMGFDYRYAGNSKYCYEQMQQRYPNHQYFFVTNNKEVKNKVKPYSFRYYRLLARSKVVVLESWLLSDLTKRDGQTWIQTWHASTVKKLLFDTTEPLSLKKSEKYRIKKYAEILNWDYLLVDNKTMGPFYETAFLLDSRQILPLGYPRVKYLIDHKKDEEKKKEIKEKYHVPGNKKIVLYAPTWRDYNVGVEDEHLDFRYLLDMDRLQELLGKKYIILFKDHNFKSRRELLTGNYIDASDFETQDTILMSDYVISDYSSIVFDAMAIDIPILIFAKDLLKYEKYRGVYPSIFNDLLHWGNINEEELAKSIKEYKIDKFYKNIKKKYTYDTKESDFEDFLDEKLK